MSSTNVLNQYQVMWVFVFFDLPTETKRDKRNYNVFKKKLEKDGFAMFQYSIYIRHCASRANAEVHIKRTKMNLPPAGHVVILHLTDKQFELMEIFFGKKETEPPKIPQQLELF